MSAEVLNYQIRREIRRGPFGIFKKSVPAGQLLEGHTLNLPLGEGEVEFQLHQGSQALGIKANSATPLAVDFEAEPQRLKPKTSTILDEQRPDTTTGRRRVTIYSANQPSERLILEAPRFEPLRVTEFEAGLLTGRIIAEDEQEARRTKEALL